MIRGPLLLVLAIAFSLGTGCDPGPGPAEDDARSCNPSNDRCPNGMVCVQSALTMVSCSSNKGVCLKGCKSTEECPAGTFCPAAWECCTLLSPKTDGGECTAPACVAGCRDDGECKSGERCVSGRCGVACSQHEDCPQDAACGNNGDLPFRLGCIDGDAGLNCICLPCAPGCHRSLGDASDAGATGCVCNRR
jgi:hypothetical protein